jgi:hypothetical protein
MIHYDDRPKPPAPIDWSELVVTAGLFILAGAAVVLAMIAFQ